MYNYSYYQYYYPYMQYDAVVIKLFHVIACLANGCKLMFDHRGIMFCESSFQTTSSSGYGGSCHPNLYESTTLFFKIY